MLGYRKNEIQKLFDVDLCSTPLHSVLEDIKAKKDGKGFPTVGYICGGVVVRTLLKQNIFNADIDIFLNNEDSLKVLKDYFSDLTVDGFNESKYAVNFETRYGSRKIKWQIINHRYANTPDHFAHFDFRHCMVHYAHSETVPMILADKLALPSILARTIITYNVSSPIYSLHRLLKYQQLGFNNHSNALKEIIGMISAGKDDADYGAMLGMTDLETHTKITGGLDPLKFLKDES